MLKTLAHRGPDGQDCMFLHGNRVGLGHHRLSIIDLSEVGAQPMPNEDAMVWLVFNGEIYNFPQLREALIRKGHAFRSRTDSEVIIHAYEEWGEDCVHHLRGIFAFGLWDDRERKLFLARDHFGVKPLYYWHNGDDFIFASQPRAIIDNPRVPRNINVCALSDYLAYGYVPFDRAIFREMSKLPAAHRLILKDGHIKIERYWQVEYVPHINDEDDAVEALREALQESVRAQMISDVPIGSFLSGGIDSSGVTALMTACSTETFQTLTVGFDEAGSDERGFARIAAERFSTFHHEGVLTEETAREMIPTFVEIYDEPFYDSSGLPTYFVAQLARAKGLKVILTGDGGDEVFAGYLWYDLFASFMKTNWLARLKGFIRHCSPVNRRKQSIKSTDDALRAYFNHIGFLPWEKQQTLLSSAIKDEANHDYLWLLRSFFHPEYPAITAAQYLDLHTYLVDDILTKVDRASMACGVEVRVPLLDHKLVELAFSINSNLVYGSSRRKHILKQSLAEWVPPEILTDRKKGFSIPLQQWMHSYLAECSMKSLSDGSLVNQGLLEPDAVQAIVSAGDSRILWLFLVAELWMRRWIEGSGSDEIRKIFTE